METAIIVVWWIALVLALILTLVILKLVVLIVRTERDILQLAQTTLLPAARGITNNTALISKLEATKGVAGKILSAAVAIEAGAASIEQKLRAVGRALTQGRS